MRAMRYPWHEEQWQQLLQLDELNRFPHGLLLAGPKETGKVAFAFYLAKHLLCQAPSANGPCHQCKSCLLFEAHSHPDFVVVEPEEEGKVIKVDLIRSLSEFASKTASMGGRRVVVLQPAEAMNINSANAFLKTLEEPGAGVCLILVTHERARLLATIRSRCRLISFPLPRLDETREWLADRIGSSEDLEQVVALSGGRPLRAARLVETDLREQWQIFSETVDAVASSRLPVSEAARTLQGLAKADAVEWFQYLVYSQVKRFASAGRAAPQLFFRFLDRLADTRKRLTSTSNLNAQLIWEEVLMDWRSVIELSPQD